ncbi:Nramp-domain-containing protein [Ceraceosorus guamensis]|uniref:Nramp-domain-containing protein n=1 Tax=Ceraceosorus guamensis TaxID=1522189 RepID=A0A316WAJ9_9BASI|nr:Nramp-domain-containing protein [Ceraceosorus guamensis]PWN46038.1 Nramp-domain-containing protein [Ceraceosorus guamensis]
MGPLPDWDVADAGEHARQSRASASVRPVPTSSPRTKARWHGKQRLSDRDAAANDVDLVGSDEVGRMKRVGRSMGVILRRHMYFVGPGIMSSVAFMDLSAGAQYGYKLLFVILLSSVMGILLQVLAVRMGAVVGVDLARATRLWLLPEERDKELSLYRDGLDDTAAAERAALSIDQRKPWRKCRLGLLWLLYIVAEGAIIATELAELVGSAIALNLLFPALPIWAGTLITSVDVFLILLIYREGASMRAFELLIAILVFIVMGCFIVLLVRVNADWGDVFYGFVPSSTLVEKDALYIGVGIVGATVMPHALFNASQWATVDRLLTRKVNAEAEGLPAPRDSTNEPRDSADGQSVQERMGDHDSRGTATQDPKDVSKYLPKSLVRLRSRAHAMAERFPTFSLGGPAIPSPESHSHRAPPSVANIKIHLAHATVDIVLSLLIFALVVNAAILIVAAAAFYYGGNREEVGDLFQAFALIKSTVGHTSAILFAVALLAAGQSASLTVTLAGQLISEGFIRWTTNPFVRRALTRGIALIPSFTVAAAVGRSGLDRMLVASQVALSMALPFVLVPLLVVTGSRSWMTVQELPLSEHEANVQQDTVHDVSAHAKKPDDAKVADDSHAANDSRIAGGPASAPEAVMPSSSTEPPVNAAAEALAATGSAVADEGPRIGRFANHWSVIIFGWLLYGLILICDGFVIVTSAMGDD